MKPARPGVQHYMRAVRGAGGRGAAGGAGLGGARDDLPGGEVCGAAAGPGSLARDYIGYQVPAIQVHSLDRKHFLVEYT